MNNIFKNLSQGEGENEFDIEELKEQHIDLCEAIVFFTARLFDLSPREQQVASNYLASMSGLKETLDQILYEPKILK